MVIRSHHSERKWQFYRSADMSRTKKTSVGRRRFLKGAAALVATNQSAVPGNATSANPQDWLSLTQEVALEPQLPIIDPHHHLWDDPSRTPQRYLLEHLVADTRGQNVRQTVFIECGSMYRADGPE